MSSLRPRFNPRAVHVEYLVVRVALRPVFPWPLWLSPFLHHSVNASYLFINHQCCIHPPLLLLAWFKNNQTEIKDIKLYNQKWLIYEEKQIQWLIRTFREKLLALPNNTSYKYFHKCQTVAFYRLFFGLRISPCRLDNKSIYHAAKRHT
jgi:hypothetical protein